MWQQRLTILVQSFLSSPTRSLVQEAASVCRQHQAGHASWLQQLRHLHSLPAPTQQTFIQCQSQFSPRRTLQASNAITAHNRQAIRCFAQEANLGSKGWGNKPPVSMQTLLIAMIVGAAGISIVKSYKDQKMQQVMSQSQQVVGKASVGGPFALTDYNGKPFTNRDLLGEFALLYFGFTFCPDICPDELEKVSEAVNMIEKQTGVFVTPVFISVDPERDTPAKVKEYVKEFHPRMLGLTGDLEAVKNASKAYRVYYSKTGEPGAQDYLVDHSIIHYLIDPEGEFVTFYAKNYTAEHMAASITEHLASWKDKHADTYHPGKTITALPSPTAVKS